MLSIHAISNVAQALHYYVHMQADRTHSTEDYYAAGEQGYFTGGGAAAMDLSGSVSREDFEELAAGRTPHGDVQNTGSTDRKVGWDLTFSAPKSVSVLWATADEHMRRKIQAAHDNAVGRALEFMEVHAAKTRRGSGLKADEERYQKVGLAAAVYRHGTSREMDPQLHSHAIVFNVAAREDGTVGAVVSHHFYEWKMAGGAAYRSELANELKVMGLQVERAGKSLHVVGVPQELCDMFSKRRLQIETALHEHGAAGAKASEIAALSTRRGKENVDREVLLSIWQSTAQEVSPNWKPSHCLDRPALDVQPLNVKAIQVEMTHQSSTVSEAQLYAAIGFERQACGNIADLEKSVSLVKADRETVLLESRRGERYTTREMLALEADMVERAGRLAKTSGHDVSLENVRAVLDARPTLSQEQRRAVEYLSKDRGIACIQGDAGTGKSFMLRAAREAWESGGYRVRGASLSGKAAQELQQSSGIVSSTLKRLEMDSRGYTDEQGKRHEPVDKLTSRDVVVIDEAGMVDSRKMADLIMDAQLAEAKVVLIGDTRQLQAIDAGAAFRAIAERIGSESLMEIRRQMQMQDRQAVRDLRDGRAEEALENLDQRGRVHQSETAREAKQETGRAVAEDLAQGKQALALTGTREEARDVSEYARESAKEKGLVAAEDVMVSTSHGERKFAVGDRVLFTRNSKNLDVKNGDLGTVREITGTDGQAQMKIELDRGGERRVDTLEYDHLELGYAVTTHKAQGSTVVCAHILANEQGMGSREWAYVAGSRHREEVHIYADRATLAELAPAWSKSRQKDVSLDYTEKQHLQECDHVREFERIIER